MSGLVTTSRGVVELKTLGIGVPVLVLHGSPGGLDGAEAMSRFLDPRTFQTILISRPGYLGTPLDREDTSIDFEADLLAAVLDFVNVGRAGVLAWSGGGPSAYRFAAKYPSRVSSLVTVAAVSFRWVAPKPDIAQRFLFGTGIGERIIGFMSKHAQKQVVGGALEGEGSVRGEALRKLIDHTMAISEQRQLVLEISRTISTAGRRQAGWENDITNFARIQSLELDRIECPTLLIHGDADTDAIFEHSRFAHSRVRDSELLAMTGGTHLAFYADPGAAEAQERARTWFRKYS